MFKLIIAAPFGLTKAADDCFAASILMRQCPGLDRHAPVRSRSLPRVLDPQPPVATVRHRVEHRLRTRTERSSAKVEPCLSIGQQCQAMRAFLAAMGGAVRGRPGSDTFCWQSGNSRRAVVTTSGHHAQSRNYARHSPTAITLISRRRLYHVAVFPTESWPAPRRCTSRGN